MNPRERAIAVLIHYFRTAFEAAGLGWTADNETEVRDIVENILRAADAQNIL